MTPKTYAPYQICCWSPLYLLRHIDRFDNPGRDHEQVFVLVKEECPVIRECGRVGTGIADLDFIDLLGVLNIRYIEECELQPLCRDTAPVICCGFLADTDDMVLIIRMQVIGVAGDLEFAEDLRACRESRDRSQRTGRCV